MIKGAQSIYRTLNILTLIVENGDSDISLKQISKQLDIPSPTVHRLLSVLKECRFVSYNPATKGYSIGQECIISPNFDRDQQILTRFSPLAREAAETFGYTVSLFARVEDECVCLKRVEGNKQIQVFLNRVGEHRPLGLGSCTLGILVALPKDEVAGILARNMAVLKKQLKSTPDALNLFLEISRNRGYGYAYDLAVESAVGISFPLFSGKEVIGSITMDAIKGSEWDEKFDDMVNFFTTHLEKLQG